jgi:hypothetical protein
MQIDQQMHARLARQPGGCAGGTIEMPCAEMPMPGVARPGRRNQHMAETVAACLGDARLVRSRIQNAESGAGPRAAGLGTMRVSVHKNPSSLLTV